MKKHKKKSVRQAQVERLFNELLSVERFTIALNEMNIQVIQPGTPIPAVYIRNETRFLPQINEDGIVVGGFFG